MDFHRWKPGLARGPNSGRLQCVEKALESAAPHIFVAGDHGFPAYDGGEGRQEPHGCPGVSYVDLAGGDEELSPRSCDRKAPGLLVDRDPELPKGAHEEHRVLALRRADEHRWSLRQGSGDQRSEERRVGKECTSRWS